jgi:methyl-accepting chemotaxis protein
VDTSASQVTAGTKLAGAAGGALEQIADAAVQSNDHAQRIAVEATSVAATTEKMSGQIKELTTSAQTLAQLSQQMRQHASRFQLQHSAAQDEAPGPRRLTRAA